jgi:hypothetical protein
MKLLPLLHLLPLLLLPLNLLLKNKQFSRFCLMQSQKMLIPHLLRDPDKTKPRHFKMAGFFLLYKLLCHCEAKRSFNEAIQFVILLKVVILLKYLDCHVANAPRNDEK